MPRRPKTYQKISGRGFLGFSRLWLASDHLLTSFSILGMESYQRYYFHQIEAFVIRRTSRRLVWNAVFGGLGGFTGALSAVLWSFSKNETSRGHPERIFAIVLAVIAGLSLLLILFNTFRGPTCAIFVQTASGLTPMAAPGRYRKALRMLTRVSPLITLAQTANTPEQSPASQEPVETTG